LVFEKRVAAAAANSLQARFQQRVVGRGKGQLVDGDDGQRLALDIHAFPKAPRGQEHGIAEFAKPV
jgi:hypothetical protein